MKENIIPPPTPILRTSLEQSVNVTSQNTIQYTPSLTLLNYDYSYFAVNTGPNAAKVYLQISPNNTNWENQSAIITLLPEAMISFVSNVIAKYARLGYQSQERGHSTTLTIYTQGR